MPHESSRGSHAEVVERPGPVDDWPVLITVVSPHDWVILLAIGLLLCICALWSIFGRIPSTLTGRGVLTRPRGEQSIDSAVPGRVPSLPLRAGDSVRAGPTIAALTSVSYFPVSEARLIQPGLRALIVPDSVDPARHGGMTGRVVSVSPVPITRRGVTETLGDADLAEELLGPGVWVEVTAELFSCAIDPTGFRWSRMPGPKSPILPGSTATVRITVESRRPIDYLLPWLKHATTTY